MKGIKNKKNIVKKHSLFFIFTNNLKYTFLLYFPVISSTFQPNCHINVLESLLLAAHSIFMHNLDLTYPSFLFWLTLLTARQFTFHNYSDWHGCLLGSFVELIITSSKDFSRFTEFAQLLYSHMRFESKYKLKGSKELGIAARVPFCLYA